MKRNAFTLVELLVTISIMSIILVLAIPSIAAITERNARKRYENYGETLVTSGKLYTDSYAIDMFGYESDGCYKIKFQQLEDKKLAKDIDYKDITCADGGDGKTYVTVRKLDGEIKYQLSMICRDGKGNPVHEQLIDESEVLCDGEAPHTGPEIIVNPENQKEYLSEDETYKVSITVKDEDGLLENNEVEYTWCRDRGCSDVAIDTTRIRYENKRDADIKSVSKKIKRPTGDGEYYLKVKSVRVVDIFNNATNYEQTFGPYRFDTTPPEVTVKAYVRNAKKEYKAGEEVASLVVGADKEKTVIKTKNSDNYLHAYKKGKIDYDKYQKLYNNWMNNTNYPIGVYYKIEFKDNISVKKEEWEYNDSVQSSSGSSSNDITNKTEIGKYLKSDGKREAAVTVIDIAGNYVKINLNAHIDLTPPTTPTIYNPTYEEWTNKSFSLSLYSRDETSGLQKYQYAYNSTGKS